MRTAKSAHQLLFTSLIVFGAGLGSRAAAQQVTAPSPAEQDRMIAVMTRYADDYTSKLPDFICEQVTTEYEAGKKSEKWRKGDTVTSKLVFNGGREQRTLEMVNDKPVRADRRPRLHTSFSTEGEFGILLSKIFDPNSQAKFNWVEWDTIRSHRAARIDYEIDVAHSTMELTNYVKAVVPYHGSVYIDPDAGTVWRVTSATTSIPEELQMISVSTVIDYEPRPIENQNYLLPVSATVILVTDRDKVKNQIEFQNYRKFGAESTITFGSEDSIRLLIPASSPTDPTRMIQLTRGENLIK